MKLGSCWQLTRQRKQCSCSWSTQWEISRPCFSWKFHKCFCILWCKVCKFRWANTVTPTESVMLDCLFALQGLAVVGKESNSWQACIISSEIRQNGEVLSMLNADILPLYFLDITLRIARGMTERYCWSPSMMIPWNHSFTSFQQCSHPWSMHYENEK